MESFYAKVRNFSTPKEFKDDTKKPNYNRPDFTKKQDLLECTYCFQVFTSFQNLNSHKRTHHMKKQYICKWCNVTFSYSGWEYHYKKHTNDQRYSCKSCNRKFYVLQQFQSHMSNHKYSCSMCDQTFVTMKQIRLHRESVHNLDEKWNPFVPKVIQNHDKRFNVNTGNRHHLQPKDDGKSFFCNSKTTSRKISHNDKSFVCDKCDVKFPKLIQLRDHIKNNRYCRPYWCNDCSSKFIQKKKLEKHVKIHLYKCQECSKSFPYKNYLDVHYYNEHMQSIDLDIKSQPGFLCRYCGLPFSTEEELQNHIKLSGENLIICAECLDVFETEYDFDWHLKTEHKDLN